MNNGVQLSNLWRPFSMPGVTIPTRFSRGSGLALSDSDGREYLDAASGLWNISLGLNNNELIGKMCDQMHDLTYSSLFHGTHGPAESLSAKLVSLTNGMMEYVYLSTTGSSAVDVAIRVSRIYQRAMNCMSKKRILSFDVGYHGCSSIGIGASGIVHKDVAQSEEIPQDFVTIPSPAHEELSLAAIKMELGYGNVAAFILEPILGSAGIIVPSPSYCAEVSRLCILHDTLLIADEVATGGGRCGSMFASNLLGFTPDIITLSKGINSGYFPIGVTIFTSRIVNQIKQAGMTLQCGSTQDGNPVGCVAALATLAFIEKHGLTDRAAKMGDYLQRKLIAMPCPVIKQVRGVGLIIGIELFHFNGNQKKYSMSESSRVRQLCQDAGLLVYHFDGGISLFPALTISDEDADTMIDILHEVFITLC